MAKAALHSMNGLNLFGSQGSSLSVIHVDPDAHYRNCVILDNLLPRESSSKETDASLLFITGFPGFAIDDPTLCRQTEERTRKILGVCYTLKLQINASIVGNIHWINFRGFSKLIHYCKTIPHENFGPYS